MERYPQPDVDEFAGVLDRRFEALFVDSLLVVLVVGALGYVGGTVTDVPLGGFGGMLVAMQFLAPIALFGYQIGMEGYYGQTVGKHLRGIVVVREDGSDCTWVAALLRNVLRIVDVLPIGYLVGIAVAYVSEDHQRVGDHVASTIVVYTED